MIRREKNNYKLCFSRGELSCVTSCIGEARQSRCVKASFAMLCQGAFRCGMHVVVDSVSVVVSWASPVYGIVE